MNLRAPVLVVDDLWTIACVIRTLLRQIGFEDIDIARNGQTALTMMRNKNYGLVISDWNIEPLNGLNLLKEVRADEKLKAMPFIIVIQDRRVDQLSQATEAGASAWIVKPFDARTLEVKIRNIPSFRLV